MHGAPCVDGHTVWNLNPLASEAKVKPDETDGVTDEITDQPVGRTATPASSQ